mgnify:CR=1 FL=1
MKAKLLQISRRYRSGLRDYLKGTPSPAGARALGAEAARAGLETLDVARIHEEALSLIGRSSKPGQETRTLVQKAARFFAEVIAPIEETHRGARESAVRLSEITRTLRRREAELAKSNQAVKSEIERRAAVEVELKRSERHYGQLLEDSARLQDQLRSLSREILSTQEEERKRISRELHDQIAATLTGINLELAALKEEVTGKNRILKRRIASTQRLVQRSVEIIHAFALDLRPSTLDDLGLIPALHSFSQAFSRQTGIRVRLNAEAAVEALNIAKRTVLYRVAQEALTNVSRHARASDVEVNLKILEGGASLSIHDNGRSFPVERLLASVRGKRLGLLGMRERVEMVHGVFAVQSEPGKGTTVRATIPMRDVERKGRLVQKRTYA